MKYDYFLIFSSMILGMVTVKIFNSIANYLKAYNRHKDDKKIKNSVILFIWALISVITVFQYFAGSYQLHEKGMNNLGLFITNLIIPSILFLVSMVVIPEFNAPDVIRKIESEKGYDLREFYNINRKTIALGGIFLTVLLAMNFFFTSLSLTGEFGFYRYLRERSLFHLTFIAILFAIGFSKKPTKEGKFWGERRFWKMQNVLSLVVLVLISILAWQVINKAIVQNQKSVSDTKRHIELLEGVKESIDNIDGRLKTLEQYILSNQNSADTIGVHK